MSILSRLWTGIVSAVAAVAVAMVVQIIGIMLVGLPVEFLQWLVLVFGTIGFLVGAIVGNRKLSATKTANNKTDERDIWIE